MGAPIQSQTAPQPVQPTVAQQQPQVAPVMSQPPQQPPQQVPSWFTGNGGGFSGMQSNTTPSMTSGGLEGMQATNMGMQMPTMDAGGKQSPQFSGCGHNGGQVMPQTLFSM